jgi:hypothetical protein
MDRASKDGDVLVSLSPYTPVLRLHWPCAKKGVVTVVGDDVDSAVCEVRAEGEAFCA